MAIQYRCVKCSQPIEVDDELAGQTARCPYCGAAGTIPEYSTYAPDTAVAARPAEWADREARELSPDEYPVRPAAPPLLQRRARTIGNYALIVTGLGLLCLLFLFIRGGILYMEIEREGLEPAEAQRVMAERTSEDPLMLVPQISMLVLMFAGFVLSIVSLTQSTRGNWQGLTSLILCLIVGLCMVLAIVVALIAGAGGIA